MNGFVQELLNSGNRPHLRNQRQHFDGIEFRDLIVEQINRSIHPLITGLDIPVQTDILSKKYSLVSPTFDKDLNK